MLTSSFAAMVRQLEELRKDRSAGFPGSLKNGGGQDSWECAALHVSPDLGERIMISAERTLLDEVTRIKYQFYAFSYFITPLEHLPTSSISI